MSAPWHRENPDEKLSWPVELIKLIHNSLLDVEIEIYQGHVLRNSEKLPSVIPGKYRGLNVPYGRW